MHQSRANTRSDSSVEGTYISPSDSSDHIQMSAGRIRNANNQSHLSRQSHHSNNVNNPTQNHNNSNINFSQIQSALRGVNSTSSGNSSVPQLYEGGNHFHGVREQRDSGHGGSSHSEHSFHFPKEPPTNTAVANSVSRDQNAAAAIPLGAYEALVKLATMPQRRHYQGSVSAAPAQRYKIDISDHEDVLNNSEISVFDVARFNPKGMSGSKVSDLLTSHVPTPSLTGGPKGKRFEYSHNSVDAPYLNQPEKKPTRSSSAPPRTSTLGTTIKQKNASPSKDEASTMSSSNNSLHKNSLYNAIYNPENTSKQTNSRAANDDKKVMITQTAKGFRTCAVPHGPKSTTVDSSTVAAAENEVISQLKGTAGGLRKVLQRSDLSRSGKLNYDDFRLGLKKTGVNISDEKASALFFSYAQPLNNMHGYYGYTGGKALDIEDFVLRIANKSTAPLYNHVIHYDTSKAENLKNAEEMRILKRVVHATSKQSDPMLVFRSIEPRQKRYLTPNQFREGLKHVGASLNDTEFEILMNRVDTNHDGRIDVGEFQNLLSTSVKEFDHASLAQKQELLHTHDRYTNTYKSNVLNVSPAVSEFAHVRDSQVVRRENYRWSKLKAQLQENKEAILKAFCPNTRHGDRGRKHHVGYATNALTPSQLRSRLANEGVYLNEEDAERLQVHLERTLGEEQRAMNKFGGSAIFPSNESNGVVTLESFCDIVGIPRAVTRDEKTVLFDPRQGQHDGGIFAASSKSLMGNPTFGTSYFVSGEENGVYVKGNRRRKIPQPDFEHHHVAHKFWNLEQTIGGPELTVSPIPSQREPYIVPNEIGTNRPLTPGRIRGKKLVPDNVNNQHLARHFAGNSSTLGSVSDTSSYLLQTPFATSGTVSYNNANLPVFRPTKQRSLSAPPRTGSSVGQLLQQQPANNQSGYMLQTQSSRNKRSSSGSVGGGSDAGSIASGTTTRSNMSGSRNTSNNNTASRVSMSLADFISPNPGSQSSASNNPFDNTNYAKRGFNLRRPIGEHHTGAVAESLSFGNR